jgi:molybdenum transport protein
MTFMVCNFRVLAPDLAALRQLPQRDALGFGKVSGRMEFTARQAMAVACSEEAERIMSMVGASVTACAPSGAVVATGAQIVVAEGSATALHAGWKVAQTLLEISGGIATAAKATVDAARSVNPAVAVVCTRKCFPGAKALSIKAIMAGGAFPHRLGLSETVLVFAQHRAFLDNEPLSAIIARLRQRAPEKKIVVEADALAEAIEIADAGADVVQVDKISANDVAVLRRHVDGQSRRPLIAAAGGINTGNAGDYARAGADVIVTSAPYTARPLDVKVAMTKSGG